MRIALIQTTQNALYDFGNPGRRHSMQEARQLQGEIIAQTLAQIARLDGPCDLIITPEAVNFPGSPEYVDVDWRELIDDAALAAFAGEARRLQSYLVLGAYTARAGRVYNSALVYDRTGALCATYDKVHLAGSEQTALARGDRSLCVDADFGRFGVCVCWDMQFPEVCRALALRGAALVVCPTWGWEGIYAHARAYENGIFVAGAMGVPYRGAIEGIRNPSEVVSPLGAVLAAAPRDRAAVVACDIDLAESDAPRALRMGDRQPGTYGDLIR